MASGRTGVRDSRGGVVNWLMSSRRGGPMKCVEVLAVGLGIDDAP